MSSSDDGVFRRFLNTDGDSGAGFKLVNVSNPLEWGKLAKTVFAALFGGFTIGVQMGLDAVLGLPATVLEAAADWVGRDTEFFRYPGGRVKVSEAGLIETVETGLLSLINEAWSPLEGLGWLAYPVAVAEALIALYIVLITVSYVREEVL